MTIESGSAAEAEDIVKNIRTFLEGINQSTILSQAASVTDKTYTFADSDTLSDSTGYNNTINTGQTTARFLSDRYILPAGTIYDNFDDNSIDTGLWTVTETPGPGSGSSATLNEQNQKIEMDCNGGNAVSTSVVQISSDTNYTDYLRWDCDRLAGSDGGGLGHKNKVEIGGTIIVDEEDGNGSPTYDDYTTGTWEIFKVGASAHRLYKNQVFVREISSALSGAVVFYSDARSGGANGATSEHDIDDVFLTFASSAVIQTDTKTMGGNVSEIFLHLNKDSSLSGTSITFDVSTDGGSAFEKTAQAINTVISGLDADNTDVEIKINLNRGTTSTPWELGYAYQVWTT